MQAESRENAEKVLKETEQKLYGNEWNEKAYYDFLAISSRDEIAQRVRQLEYKLCLKMGL